MLNTPEETQITTADELPTTESETTRETVRELTAVSAFTGKFPDIPTNGVDLDALTAGDDNPVFVTLPILEIGRVSKNGLLYDKALVESIVEQINAKKPGGIFGHIPDDERPTAFPLPAAQWVGAVIDGNVAYGKAYIADRAAAAYIRRLKAVGGGIGTSIYGSGIAETTPEGARRLSAFVLESLDFAPLERASLQMSGEFEITREMSERDTMENEQLRQALAELSADDLYAALGDERAAEVAETYGRKNKKRIVAAEMAQTAEKSEVVISEQQAQISRLERENTSMRERIAEYERVEFNAGLDALVAGAIDWKTVSADQEKVVNSVRRNLRKQVVAELNGAQDLKLAKSKMETIMESEDFRPIVEAARDFLAGGAAVTSGKGKDAREAVYEESEAAAREWRI